MADLSRHEHVPQWAKDLTAKVDQILVAVQPVPSPTPVPDPTTPTPPTPAPPTPDPTAPTG